MEAARQTSPRAGLFALVLKLGFSIGGKLLSVGLKLLKGLKVGKAALAVASFGTYAVLFSWQFALVLIASLVIHEMGHLWAMRRFGMKTRGLYLIPLLGAAAVAETEFPSRKAESVIALMGPLWGLGMALAAAGIYALTGSPLVAALAGWMAMLNLFNLLPINPLDGGRLMKSVAYSISSGAGYVFMAIGLCAAFAATMALKLGLFALILVIGITELLQERKQMRRAKDKELVIGALAAALDVPADHERVASAIFDRHRQLLDGHVAVFPSKLLDGNPYTGSFSPREWDRYFEDGIVRTAKAACRTYPRLFGLLKGRVLATDTDNLSLDFTRLEFYNVDRSRWRPKQSYFNEFSPLLRYLLAKNAMPKMTSAQTVIAFLAYCALAAALAGLMFAMSHVPAADAALEVFKS